MWTFGGYRGFGGYDGYGGRFGFYGGGGGLFSELDDRLGDGWAATSAKANSACAEARRLITAKVAAHPRLATAQSFGDVVSPTTHVVDNLWGGLKRDFKLQGVLIKRRDATQAERNKLHITTARPRYYISIKIQPRTGAAGGAGPAAAGGAAPPAPPSTAVKVAPKAKKREEKKDPKKIVKGTPYSHFVSPHSRA